MRKKPLKITGEQSLQSGPISVLEPLAGQGGPGKALGGKGMQCA
jgi:hypothetical protein